ncbi:hypothetical protein M2390_002918 [Mycetocola sp. BIGb0189]|uniref:M23 family metallopeptidase n=1 Tax=Mycetocola sp. BIGb0189 TaxID=2940604 RepID=UPI0021671870|nr:M23 family metallopeptidase [Mycetocola sp. BIGb0189]MCS4277709.1 hypothetical protein [Mycetocola sp. BIGb0189]
MPLPFPAAQVGARFGKRNYPPNPYHKGIDYPLRAGTPVPAAAAGTVIGTGHTAGFNHWVEIDHGHSLTTRYHMLGTVQVARGQKVAEGQTIGTVGPKFGVSTGEHLHFELHDKTRRDPIYGTAIDPLANIGRLTPAAPASIPLTLIGDTMIRIQSPGRGIALIGAGYYRHLTTNEEVEQSGPLMEKHVNGNDRQFDLWVSMALAGRAAVTGERAAVDTTGVVEQVLAGIRATGVSVSVDVAAVAKAVNDDLIARIAG